MLRRAVGKIRWQFIAPGVALLLCLVCPPARSRHAAELAVAAPDGAANPAPVLGDAGGHWAAPSRHESLVDAERSELIEEEDDSYEACFHRAGPVAIALNPPTRVLHARAACHAPSRIGHVPLRC